MKNELTPRTVKEEFVWTDELVLQAARHYKSEYDDTRGEIRGKEIIEQFKASKQRKPVLFVSEDRVECFEGDKMVLLSTENWKIAVDIAVCANPFAGDNGQFKYFAKQELAQAYIDLHKPQYSEQMVRDAWGNKVQILTASEFISELKKQVK